MFVRALCHRVMVMQIGKVVEDGTVVEVLPRPKSAYTERLFKSAFVIAAGHAFVQNLRRRHYELATELPPPLRLATAFTELALAM